MDLWRATDRKDPYFDEGSWWAETEEDGLAYTDNPGFGGPDLFRGRFRDDPGKTLDLTGRDASWEWWTALKKDVRDNLRGDEIGRLHDEYDEAYVDGLEDGDVAQSWWERELARGIYVHDLVEEYADDVRLGYDWIRIVDSFPAGATTRMRMSPLSEKEEASMVEVSI